MAMALAMQKQYPRAVEMLEECQDLRVRLGLKDSLEYVDTIHQLGNMHKKVSASGGREAAGLILGPFTGRQFESR